MPRIVHYDIQANDPERASRFYGETFGWLMRRTEATGEYTFSCDDVNALCHGEVRRGQVGDSLPVTVRVPAVDASIHRVLLGGGKLVIPKKAIPGVGYMAYCEDPEGHVFGLFSSDPEAR